MRKREKRGWKERKDSGVKKVKQREERERKREEREEKEREKRGEKEGRGGTETLQYLFMTTEENVDIAFASLISMVSY